LSDSGLRFPRWFGVRGAGDRPAADLMHEPLRGWRAWRVVERKDGPALASWWLGTLWPAHRALESVCPQHGSRPAVHHACGIHAFGNRDEALGYIGRSREPLLFARRPERALGVALGRVSGWGRAVQHTRGWRSQYGYPYDLYLLAGGHDLARALANAYAVETSPLPPDT
jgi:hypothetical protein